MLGQSIPLARLRNHQRLRDRLTKQSNRPIREKAIRGGGVADDHGRLSRCRLLRCRPARGLSWATFSTELANTGIGSTLLLYVLSQGRVDQLGKAPDTGRLRLFLEPYPNVFVEANGGLDPGV